jgi:hypothetical protein
MQKFEPVKQVKAERPTVTMLSHVWYAKDIKTALLAADIIINEWGFEDYHLDIYGAIDKAPTYSTECQEIIASKGLRGKATLRGTADPVKVLENTWLFLNSSLSEGLPLALGEAALTGAPVVCTDVGASLRVLSDPDDFSRFSAVVAPNDARALARAQISLLGLLGEWSQYAEDTEPAPILTSSPTPADVAKITRRMYEKSGQRRKLGMMTRAIVQKSFSGDRYLREHEQMLWIGKARKLMATGDMGLAEFANAATVKEISTPAVDEQAITIPPSAVRSWRSSAASVVPSRPTTYRLPIPRIGHASSRSISSQNRSSFIEVGSLQIPSPQGRPSISSSLVHPPRGEATYKNHSPTSSLQSSGKRHVLWREELRSYRNSDVSVVMKDGFGQSHPYRGSAGGPAGERFSYKS